VVRARELGPIASVVSPLLAGKPENGSGRWLTFLPITDPDFAPPPSMRGEFVNPCTVVLVASGVAEDGIAKAILPVVRKLRADRARRQRRPTLSPQSDPESLGESH
jgi:hypothetical protein